ncbi:ComEA family DNA-binding protein [Glaciimonas soli]|uniref:Helix-hairpin-helix domain-containing protein n=1 Tax=Glaciimonas soli TaxID=2590999 RepID=A0A843YX14_9BURK|nr:helix-hairpin-helix domain-containing protein [Glaciimonas soli]MQR02537.1 helix-hairpin-helix domain-containing protein [Glaciimonas soli]
MLKKILWFVVVSFATMGLAFAQVDVNKGDRAALDGIKGIGPATSQRIIDERTKGGNFKDWPDFETRVKGISGKKSVKLSEAGLTVNGQAKTNATTPATTAPKEVKNKTAAVTKK